MKIIRASDRIHYRLAMITCAFATSIWLTGAGYADDEKSDELRTKAEKLMRKAADLKAQGSAEEATRLAREAGELQQAAKKVVRDSAKSEKLRNQDPGLAKLEEARGQLKRLSQEAEELHQKGRHEDAERLQDQARRMKEKIAAAQQNLGDGDGRKFSGPAVGAVQLPKVHENAIPHTGSVVEYWPDGRRKSERIYKAGKMISAVYYASDGRRVYEMAETGGGN